MPIVLIYEFANSSGEISIVSMYKYCFCEHE